VKYLLHCLCCLDLHASTTSIKHCYSCQSLRVFQLHSDGHASGHLPICRQGLYQLVEVAAGQRPCGFIQAILVFSRPSTHWHTTYQLSAQWTRLYICTGCSQTKLIDYSNAAEFYNRSFRKPWLLAWNLSSTQPEAATYVGRSLRRSQSPALCVWKVGRLTQLCCKTGWGEDCKRKLRASMAAVGLMIAAISTPVLLPYNDAWHDSFCRPCQ